MPTASLKFSPQVYGPLLRILQVSAADSGEYVCHVSNGANPKEASISVSVQQSSGPSHGKVELSLLPGPPRRTKVEPFTVTFGHAQLQRGLSPFLSWGSNYAFLPPQRPV